MQLARRSKGLQKLTIAIDAGYSNARRQQGPRHRPADAGSMPITHFINVLLPLPLVPSSTTVSPGATDNDMSSVTRIAS
jgi:hypothetical protein